MLDIDDFKGVNDRLGHVAGDEVLRAVADAAREGRRDSDLAARYGGEELALILPGADLAGAARAAERIRHADRAPRSAAARHRRRAAARDGQRGRRRVRSRASEDRAALVAAADDALYEAKRAGKNRVRFAEAPAALPAE